MCFSRVFSLSLSSFFPPFLCLPGFHQLSPLALHRTPLHRLTAPLSLLTVPFNDVRDFVFCVAAFCPSHVVWLCAGPSAAKAVPSTTAVVQKRLLATNRPMSPHLTIYKPQLNSMTSITFRATGIAMTLGTACRVSPVLLSCRPSPHHCLVLASTGVSVGSIALLGASHDLPYYIDAIKSSGVAPLAKFCVAFPLVYHYIGGIRHIVCSIVGVCCCCAGC